MVMGYYPFYFQGYGILCSIFFVNFQGYWIFRKTNYRDICQFILDCLGVWDIGTPYISLTDSEYNDRLTVSIEYM